ncbi:uncharacterized mitochondrial protein AtMg00810-like [Arachis duranensis]|uniref:Uncharacterized mitochondrial protein AtMg00810-like n=1 Tax=Arachis duranensis TaxID=130453 RepID=A0A6P4B6A8_ARADU|nr:uncharacterized mitochondrial protein AtMg00810-like [Arachis duranensis]
MVDERWVFAIKRHPDGSILKYKVKLVAKGFHQVEGVDFDQLPHWLGVKRILRYLAGTIDHRIVFRPCTDLRIFAFADSDWGSDVDDRCSTSGSCVFLGSNIVAWSSRKQRSVSRSSVEAEFWSIAAVETDIRWLQNLLS